MIWSYQCRQNGQTNTQCKICIIDFNNTVHSSKTTELKQDQYSIQ